jgi:hypothetical protein
MRKFLESAEGQATDHSDRPRRRCGSCSANLGPLLTSLSTHGDDVAASLGLFGQSAQFAVDHLGPLLKYVPALAGAYLLLKKTGHRRRGRARREGRQSIASADRDVPGDQGAHQPRCGRTPIGGGTNCGRRTETRTRPSTRTPALLARGRAVIAMIAQKVAMVSARRSRPACRHGRAVAAQHRPDRQPDRPGHPRDRRAGRRVRAAVEQVVRVPQLLESRVVTASRPRRPRSAPGSRTPSGTNGSRVRGTAFQEGRSKVLELVPRPPRQAQDRALEASARLISAPYKMGVQRGRRDSGTTPSAGCHFTVPELECPSPEATSYAIPTDPACWPTAASCPPPPAAVSSSRAERGEDEAIVPLSKMGQVAGAAGGVTTVRVSRSTGADRDIRRSSSASPIRVDNLLQTN